MDDETDWWMAYQHSSYRRSLLDAARLEARNKAELAKSDPEKAHWLMEMQRLLGLQQEAQG